MKNLLSCFHLNDLFFTRELNLKSKAQTILVNYINVRRLSFIRLYSLRLNFLRFTSATRPSGPGCSKPPHPTPLFFDQTAAGRAEKFFLETGLPLLSKGVDDPTHLKVWIRH